MNAFIIYMISFLSAIDMILMVISILSGMASALCFLVYFLASNDPDDALIFDTEEKCKSVFNVAKAALIIFTISTATSIFIPSENHMVAMLLSSYATTDNLNAAIEQFKRAVLFLKENGVF